MSESTAPVEAPQHTQMGQTFAERQAARLKAEKAAKPSDTKQVSEEAGGVEDKAVKSASKKAAKKASK